MKALLSWFTRTRKPKTFSEQYSDFFSLHEVKENPILVWLWGAILLVFFLTFNQWIGGRAITKEMVLGNQHLCPPYFQDCGDWYFLSALPQGYSQTTLYMWLFAVIILVVYFLWKRNYVLAHAFTCILWLWEVLLVFFLSDYYGGNYDYYQITFAFVLLFLPHKEFFAKVSLVLFYFLSTAVKIHEGWTLGTYFSSMKTGLPLFPDSTIPLWTNLVIGMEMIGAWFLLSRNKYTRGTALLFFVIFHLYSGILVYYRYPATVLPVLLILFGPMFRPTPLPVDKKSLPGWTLLACLLGFQMISHLIPGDEKMTLEGNKYGLYMFEANHQCISQAFVYRTDKTMQPLEQENAVARSRCNPYRYWFHFDQMCERDPTIERIEWRFGHSINGGAFYEIVNVADACALTYKPFGRNEWIKTPEEGAKPLGMPLENIYR